MVFGGLLGSTFNFVFETQMEKLQNGDRFYYLHAQRRAELPHPARGATPSPSSCMRNDGHDAPAVRHLLAPGLHVRARATRDRRGRRRCRRSRPPSGTSTTLLDPERRRHLPLQRRGARRDRRHGRGATASTPARATTRSGATAATTASRVAPATTPSTAARATTCSPTCSATTTSRAARATTRSTPGGGFDLILGGAGGRLRRRRQRTPKETFAGVGNDFVLARRRRPTP